MATAGILAFFGPAHDYEFVIWPSSGAPPRPARRALAS